MKIGVKPFEVAVYEGSKKVNSIGIDRIKNVYMEDKKVILEILHNQIMKTFTISKVQRPKYLFQDILYHL